MATSIFILVSGRRNLASEAEETFVKRLETASIAILVLSRKMIVLRPALSIHAALCNGCQNMAPTVKFVPAATSFLRHIRCYLFFAWRTHTGINKS